MKKNNAGYSFLEVFIVMVIMVVLIMAAVETYVHMRKKAIELSERTLIASVGTAMKNYYARYNAWLDPYQSVNPLTLLKDSAPEFRTELPPVPSDNKTWGLVATWGTVRRYNIYCPHYTTTPTPKGNYWMFVILDPGPPVIKPGTMLQIQAYGH
jgi:type II secretory pathway pseudopilin PulG